MPTNKPTIYLIAGCNGAGKTTFANEFLPKEVKCLRFLNADLIASRISPLTPSTVAARAGRILLRELHDSLVQRETVGLETTLSGLAYVRVLRQAKQCGYSVKLFYLWLPDSSTAIRRVHERVRKGGHNVPIVDIRRRFCRSLINLEKHYLTLADSWAIFDNSGDRPGLVAEHDGGKLRMVNPDIFSKIQATRKRI